ncbi:MAG: tetratricopeptide repeat protein [Bacteroidota bacterium]
MKHTAVFTFCTLLLFPLFAQFNTGTTSPEAKSHYRTATQAANPVVAKQQLFQAIANDANFVDAYNQLANLYIDLEQYDSAAHYYETSLDRYPRGIRAHQGLARVCQLQGNFTGAVQQYEELLRHFPNYPPAFYGIALVQFNQNNYSETIRNSEQAMRLYLQANRPLPAADARMLAAQAYQQQGEYAQALKYLKASKKHFGDKAYFPYRIGMCYFMMGKPAKAEEYFAEAELKGYKVPTHVRQR